MNQLAKRYLPQCIGIVLLAFAFNPDNPYGYYIFLRFSIFLIALYLIAAQAVKLEIEYFLYVLIGVVIIYNPFIKVHLGRDIWGIVNICTIILFIYSMWLWRTQNNNTEDLVNSNLVANREINIPTKKPGTSYIEFNAIIKSLNDYKSAVEHYISWTNHLEALYVTRAVDEGFEILEKQVVSNSYRTGASYKVTGLLIVDAIREFKANHREGVNFLRNLNESLLEELEGNSEEQFEDEYAHDDTELSEESDSYHPLLDEEVERIEKHLKEKKIFVPLRGNGRDLNITAELIVYVASYIAMLNSGINMASVSWNSFKSSIENRILSTLDNPPSLSKSIVAPDGGITLAHYTSEYWGDMTRMEELILNNRESNEITELEPLVNYLHRGLGSSNLEHKDDIQNILIETIKFASKKIIPKVINAFS